MTKEQIFEIHRTTLNQQGGGEGLRDENGLLSALVSPENRFYYENAELAVCAATYAFHLINAHAFIDGNKRVGAIAAEVFLLMNGAKLISDTDTLEKIYLKVSSGEMNRDELEKFYLENTEFF